MTRPDLPKPRAVIFDWDNTLVDTWPIIHQALHRTFTDFGLEPWTLQMTKERVAKSMRDSFPALFGENWQKAGTAYQQHYRASHLGIQALPGAVDILERLKHHQIPTLVVSNKKGPTLRTEIQHLGWNDYFQATIGSDDAARDKPHPDPVHLALTNLEMPPGADIWFVGDSEVDLETAQATGCTPILYGDFALGRPKFTAIDYHGFPYTYHAIDHMALGKLFDLHYKTR